MFQYNNDVSVIKADHYCTPVFCIPVSVLYSGILYSCTLISVFLCPVYCTHVPCSPVLVLLCLYCIPVRLYLYSCTLCLQVHSCF